MTTPLRCPACGDRNYELVGEDDDDTDRHYCRNCQNISYLSDSTHLRESHRRLLEACEAAICWCPWHVAVQLRSLIESARGETNRGKPVNKKLEATQGVGATFDSIDGFKGAGRDTRHDH